MMVLVSIGIMACSNKKIDTKRAFEEMKKHEIQVVSDAQILEAAKAIGNEISQNLIINSYDSIAGIDYKFENTVLDSLQNPVLIFQKPPVLSGIAREIYDAYVYNHENDIPSTENVQLDKTTKVLVYTSPVRYNNEVVGILIVSIPRKDIVLGLNK